MFRKLTLNCLLVVSLGSAGVMRAVVWDRKNLWAAEAREERPPEETPAAGPGEDDPSMEPFIIKAPPVPKAPVTPRPLPKPQPTPRPTPRPPGATPTPGPKPTPTPPV